MFIDLETGTIVNGPVVWVNDNGFYTPDLDEMSDSEVIEWATEWGTPVGTEK